MNGTLWTKERDAQLVKSRKQGLSFGKIAAELGDVTRSAVIGRADRLGLAGQPRSTRLKGVRKEKPPVREPTQVKPILWGAVLTNLTAHAAAILDLEPHHCRWPVNDAPFMFCGDAKRDGSSYCTRHFGASRGRSWESPRSRNQHGTRVSK